MERIGARLWHRAPRHYVGLVLAAASIVVSLTLFVPAVAIGSGYLDLDGWQGPSWFGSVAVVFVVALLVVLLLDRVRLEPVRTWCRGERADPEATRSALLHLPRVIVKRLAGAGSLVVAGSFAHVLWMADPGRQGIAALVIAHVLVVGAGLQLMLTLLQVLVRPAAVDVGHQLERTPVVEHGGTTVRRRLVVITIVVGSLTGVLTPLAVVGSGADSRDYLFALVAGTVFASYLAWLFDLAVFRPTLAPLRDALDGTVRVRRGDLSTPVPVSTLDELGDLVSAVNEMQTGLRDREALHAAFGSYVDPLLAQRLVESGSSVFEGEDLEVTVMFADVRDFTSYAEGVSPSVAVDRLNRLFDVVVPVIHEHGGHANHYLGDGLLAVFGAPQSLEAHADAAVAAAVQIQQQVKEHLGAGLRLGIGINTGPVIAGTVGGGGRHEFTVIGDTVNVAARVEQLTKDTGDPILITEGTRLALRPPRPRTTKRGAFQVRGKTAKVVLHAVNPFPRSRR
jgi:class 3 adenylate cyclase